MIALGRVKHNVALAHPFQYAGKSCSNLANWLNFAQWFKRRQLDGWSDEQTEAFKMSSSHLKWVVINMIFEFVYYIYIYIYFR